jgi:hypothetical protein
MNKHVSTWVVAFAMVFGFAVACSLPTSPTAAKGFPTEPSSAGPMTVTFILNDVGWPAPDSRGVLRTEINEQSIDTTRIVTRQSTSIYESAWTLTLFKLASNTPGISPVCVDNMSGELVRCAARVQ